MLMFAKTFLQSFNYDIIDVFMFPEEDSGVAAVYEKHKVKSCQLYQNSTDTDITSLSFIFICDFSQINKKESRNIIFEVMIVSKVIKRLYLSDDLCAQFGVQDKTLKKQVGLYEIKSVDNPNIIKISINPKECFEKYRDKKINKKHKGLKRDTPGMDFEAYSSRLLSLHEFCGQGPKNIQQKKNSGP